MREVTMMQYVQTACLKEATGRSTFKSVKAAITFYISHSKDPVNRHTIVPSSTFQFYKLPI
uniref:Uncharacterized protein n=1 Tax=Anguilla anguilla TaxID=7936 RepID=A0A0E9XE96_ANGAN